MGFAEEIRELKELHDDGTLSDAEFAQAKAALLADSSRGRDRSSGSLAGDPALGAAAKSWVKLQTVMAVVVVALVLIFVFGFFLPSWNRTQADFDRRWNEFPGTQPPKPGE